MKQLVIDQEPRVGYELILEGNNFHYLKKVRRIKLGDKILFLGPSGKRYYGKLLHIDDQSLKFEVLNQMEIGSQEGLEITLYQCLPKGKKMEQIIRQAAEAGVKKLVPLESEYTIPQYDSPKDYKKKQERWQKIAQEAAQQSGSLSVLQIEEITALSKISPQAGLKLYGHPDPDCEPLHHRLSDEITKIALLIGPEGGLSPADLQTLDRADFFPVYLGQSILRTENAGLFLVGAVKVILLEKESWRAC
ncbi:MAG: 16S rRNA (uracil(1498)-N(3))-methyltransferase [Spirochaetales bacterium]|nr:16S rRNA (uracil(1498)-N(3))-methyltransferase [Spirochaetales bacterium]